MKGLRAIVRKELIHIRRDPKLIGYVIGLPILILLLFGFGLRLKVDDLSIAVWDQDHSFFSLEVKDRLQNEAGMRLREVDSVEAIQALLRAGVSQLGLVIPADFSRRVMDGRQTTFRLLVDGTMPTLAFQALYGAQVLTAEESTRALILQDPDLPTTPVRPNPIRLEQVVLFNPKMRDSDFFLPGTLAIVIMIVTLTLATGITREKEQQTIEQLWVTPLSRFALVGGKLIPYAAIAACDTAVALVLSRTVFALPIHGSLVAVVVLTALFILSLLAVGALISVRSATQLQAQFLNVAVFIVSVCMSGFVFPIEAMPAWLRPTAWILPMTYFVDGIRGLALKASPPSDLLRDFLMLGVAVAVFGSLSVVGMKKQLG